MKTPIQICGGQRCKMNFADDVMKAAKKATVDRDDIFLEKSCCMGMCTQGPNLKITNQETGETEVCHQVTEMEIEEIVKSLK